MIIVRANQWFYCFVRNEKNKMKNATDPNRIKFVDEHELLIKNDFIFVMRNLHLVNGSKCDDRRVPSTAIFV